MPFDGLTRREIDRTANALRWVPDRVKRKILGSNMRQFVGNFALGLEAMFTRKDGSQEPDLAMRLAWSELYARIAGMVGPANQVILQLNASLRVHDENELRELVEAGRSFRDSQRNATIDLEALFDECVELASALARKKPELLERAVMLELATHCRGSDSLVGPYSRDESTGRNLEGSDENGRTTGHGGPNGNGNGDGA